MDSCLTEAAELGVACNACSDVLRAENTVDSELQIGDRLQASGNLAAARRHFRRAVMLGGADGAVKLAAVPDLCMTAMCDLFPERYSVAEVVPDPALLWLIRALSWCEQQFDKTHRQHEVAYQLIAAGYADLARATFEMAFLREGFSAERLREHARIAIQTGLWPERRADTLQPDDLDGRFDVLAGLRQVVEIAAGDPTFLNGKQGLEDFLTRQLLAFDEALNVSATPARAVAPEDFPRLADLLSRISSCLPHSVLPHHAAALGSLLQEAWTFVSKAAPAVSFGLTTGDLPGHVMRVLTNNLADFMRSRHHIGPGLLGSPRVFQIASRIGAGIPGAYFASAASWVYPDAEFLAVLGAEAAAATGPAAEPREYRPLVERVAVFLGHSLELKALEVLVHRLLDAQYLMAAFALIEEIASRGSTPINLFRKTGVVLRHAGLSNLAVILQQRLAQSYPDDFAIVMELGIQRKITGDFAGALAAFKQCIALAPDNPIAWRELLAVASEVEPPKEIALLAGDSRVARELAMGALRYRLHLEPVRYVEGHTEQFGSIELQDLAPELPPELNLSKRPVPGRDRIKIMQFGWQRRRSRFGNVAVLRGVVAVRLSCYSSIPIAALRVRIDGRTVAHLTTPGIGVADSTPPQNKYVFNAWLDVSSVSPGLHEIQCYFEEQTSGYRLHEEVVFVDPPSTDAAHALSDAAVPNGVGETALQLQDRINTAVSMVRPSGRRIFTQVPRKILVVRADQLGDFVASIPAILRLKTFLPDAVFTALVTPANEALARSLGLFSEIIQADFSYDASTRRRYMPLPSQIALRDRLNLAQFELAIDLCPGVDSRPLLRLSGARHMVGFNPQAFPWLTFGIESAARDPVNGREHRSHATMVLSLVEALGTALSHHGVIIPNPVGRDGLERFGVGADDRYVFLHAGARLLIKRWPFAHFVALARLVVLHTKLKVVMLTDEAPAGSDATQVSALDSSRFHLTKCPVDFADLEMLIAHCSVFVGNDTGPKHLAALRGAKVVSIHMGQVNWDEWGQEGDGFIISRRLPCCGCGIEEAEDCGKELACLVNIRPQEVFDTVRRML